MTARFQFRILSSIAELDAASWEPLLGNSAQGFGYFRACELAPPPNFRLYAAGLFDGDELVAGTPMFAVDFRLGTLMSGSVAPIGRWLHRNAPSLVNVPIIGAGSPHSDDVSLVFSSRLDDDSRGQALDALLDGIYRHAAAEGARVVIVKSIVESADAWAARHFARRGYARIASLPVARLTLPRSTDDYIASLSANMRSNIRRKLKKAARLRLEERDNVGDLKVELNTLRDATRARGKTDYDVFEGLSPDYFERVLEHGGGRAKLLTYWQDDTLIGFAMALIDAERVTERYSGLRYPEAIETGAFFLNWMTMVRLGIEHGAREYNAGETTYLTKARLGCKFERSWIYIRHRANVLNPVLRAVAPLLAFDKTDPDLKLLGAEAPYR